MVICARRNIFEAWPRCSFRLEHPHQKCDEIRPGHTRQWRVLRIAGSADNPQPVHLFNRFRCPAYRPKVCKVSCGFNDIPVSPARFHRKQLRQLRHRHILRCEVHGEVLDRTPAILAHRRRQPYSLAFCRAEHIPILPDQMRRTAAPRDRRILFSCIREDQIPGHMLCRVIALIPDLQFRRYLVHQLLHTPQPHRAVRRTARHRNAPGLFLIPRYCHHKGIRSCRYSKIRCPVRTRFYEFTA